MIITKLRLWKLLDMEGVILNVTGVTHFGERLEGIFWSVSSVPFLDLLCSFYFTHLFCYHVHVCFVYAL